MCLPASPSGRSAGRMVIESAKSVRAPNKPVRGSPLNPGWAPGSARSSARLTHIALASKPLESRFWFAYCGSGNVANRRPLGASSRPQTIVCCAPGAPPVGRISHKELWRKHES
jgi:hypothetical protein